jgi:hypothetical protein
MAGGHAPLQGTPKSLSSSGVVATTMIVRLVNSHFQYSSIYGFTVTKIFQLSTAMAALICAGDMLESLSSFLLAGP